VVRARGARCRCGGAGAAAAVAPAVANVLQEETGRDAGLESFLTLAAQFGSLGGAKRA